jgi:hypothetical protein
MAISPVTTGLTSGTNGLSNALSGNSSSSSNSSVSNLTNALSGNATSTIGDTTSDALQAISDQIAALGASTPSNVQEFEKTSQDVLYDNNATARNIGQLSLNTNRLNVISALNAKDKIDTFAVNVSTTIRATRTRSPIRAARSGSRSSPRAGAWWRTAIPLPASPMRTTKP